MQKWEYLTLRFSNNTWYQNTNGNETTVAKNKFREWSDLYNYINELGIQGWELVSVISDDYRYTFKRPKP
jgi:hypothetical protein